MIVLLVVTLMLLAGCESFKRDMKGISSEFGGLNRVVSVYTYDGKLLRTYKGTLDIEFGEGGKVKFDLDGKRYIIYNAVVIVEEK